MTAAPTSTITAAPPTKETDMNSTTALTLATRRGAFWLPIARYPADEIEAEQIAAFLGLDITDEDAKALAAAAVLAHDAGGSDEAFDLSLARALRAERENAAAAEWPFTDEEQDFLEELQAASRPTVWETPKNGITDVEAATLASCRRQEADAAYAALLADQERLDELQAMEVAA
ncbi:hypothetical protein Sked_29000 [Sanguibacter keddieii DSM 10542]|uniref:Uncharacterized protein n=1 Tax=Sanguibacter keddieii (strain ATCC 51767 / DSM 10542 / NCFB 3025 / ST-74) TaxID=446469 RepID=D1BBN1_SANKS|nr:hypothetical protein [Sanguibacter keddieii]ACZ22802.1 hypothetical protein Sked_29000 [Sanguibacter keddieii DSM 10542]